MGKITMQVSTLSNYYISKLNYTIVQMLEWVKGGKFETGEVYNLAEQLLNSNRDVAFGKIEEILSKARKHLDIGDISAEDIFNDSVYQLSILDNLEEKIADIRGMVWLVECAEEFHIADEVLSNFSKTKDYSLDADAPIRQLTPDNVATLVFSEIERGSIPIERQELVCQCLSGIITGEINKSDIELIRSFWHED